MSIQYHCPHTGPLVPPLPPSYLSSSSSFHPLEELYFCEECDAVRCDGCVGVEVASYFCPNCLFDVPGANVRGDRNRCARSCFSCPLCSSSLSIQSAAVPQASSSSSAVVAAAAEASQPTGSPYILACAGCKWSSKEIGWEFEKATGIALQLQRLHTLPETIQTEFDALKEHLEGYMTSSLPPTTPHKTRVPSRHISHLTQMAAKALHRPVHGLPPKRKLPPPGKEGEMERVGWDEIEEYKTTESWKQLGLERGLEDVEMMRGLGEGGCEGVASVEKRWGKSWEGDRVSKHIFPERIALQTKRTKRCPDANCRHLLIQPDTKGIRMKIKMVALNYLPVMEIGRRRRRLNSGDLEEAFASTAEDVERRKREGRRTRATLTGGVEEEEPMGDPLRPGESYTFQLALTNPLYDPIQIRLTQPHGPKRAPKANCSVNIVTPHFTISALKDAWAYDEEDEGDEEGSEDTMSVTTGTGTGTGTQSRKSRMSVLAGGSVRDKRNREAGVEKKGNTSKIPVDVEISPDAEGPVEFDLEVRYTYRSEGEGTPVDKEGGMRESGMKEEYKTFTFWVRISVGEV